MQHTKVQLVTRENLFALRAMVAKLLPHLQWRHSGLGVLQAYIHEGGTDELRVHVWDNRLRRLGIEESGLLHDHRFDMHSTVLIGDILQVEYTLTAIELQMPTQLDRHVLHEVVHARKAFAENRTHDGGVALLPGEYTVSAESVRVPAGHSYTFPKRAFHGTWPTSPTITLVRKMNQWNVPARILAPKDKPVVHAFADIPLPEADWRPILHEANVKLLEALEV